MRRLAIFLAGAALLAGCAAPAVPEAASAVQAVSSEAGTGHAGSRTEQLAVLDGLVDFGADTAGCSLKTARAAAVLVEYLSASEFEDGTADTWRAGLSGDAQERPALNWPGILAEAQAICADPAACADELASAEDGLHQSLSISTAETIWQIFLQYASKYAQIHQPHSRNDSDNGILLCQKAIFPAIYLQKHQIAYPVRKDYIIRWKPQNIQDSPATHI